MPTSREPRMRALLVEPHPDPGHREFRDDDLRDALRQRLDQLELGIADELQQTLRDPLVVERVLDPVAGRGTPDIGRHLEIDDDLLLDAAFPVPDADDALGRESAQEDGVHGWRA